MQDATKLMTLSSSLLAPQKQSLCCCSAERKEKQKLYVSEKKKTQREMREGKEEGHRPERKSGEKDSRAGEERFIKSRHGVRAAGRRRGRRANLQRNCKMGRRGKPAESALKIARVALDGEATVEGGEMKEERRKSRRISIYYFTKGRKRKKKKPGYTNPLWNIYMKKYKLWEEIYPADHVESEEKKKAQESWNRCHASYIRGGTWALVLWEEGGDPGPLHFMHSFMFCASRATRRPPLKGEEAWLSDSVLWLSASMG